jgi:hypothetical protein
LSVLSDTISTDIPSVTSLIDGGRLDDAVQELATTGHPYPHAAVGRTWARRQADAFGAVGTTPRPSWPPAMKAPLAPKGTLPEITRSELDARTLANGVVGSGSLIVRGLLDAAEAQSLRQTVDSVLSAREAVRNGDSQPGNVAWFDRYDPSMNTFAGDSAAYVFDSPTASQVVAQTYHRLGLPAVLTEYLGEPPALSLRKWVLRRVPPEANSGWHQDGNFLGVDTRNMNLWISLSDSGVDAPGIDVVPFRLDGLVPSGTEDAHFDWSVGASVVQELVGDYGVARPEFKAGDALFFDHLCLHATGVSPGMTNTRYAIESWFFAPSHFPNDYTGFLL